MMMIAVCSTFWFCAVVLIAGVHATHIANHHRSLLDGGIPWSDSDIANATAFLSHNGAHSTSPPETLLIRASDSNANVRLLRDLQDQGQIGCVSSVHGR